MRVHIVLLLIGGIPDDPEAFAEPAAAERRFAALAEQHNLLPDDPHNEDYDLYLWPDMEVSA